jgi:MOSC domain-containing protein YiiM
MTKKISLVASRKQTARTQQTTYTSEPGKDAVARHYAAMNERVLRRAKFAALSAAADKAGRHLVKGGPDIDSLHTGDRIRIGGTTFKVTCVDRNCGVDGHLVELTRPSNPNTLYTLMRHAKKPGTFVLSTSRSSRDIDGWRKVEKR